MFGFIHKLSHVWETVQVELQGHYSLERFRDLLSYARTSSSVQNTVVICVTPLPGLLLLLFLDALPLVSPQEGIFAQTPALYIRLFCTGALASWTLTRSVHLSTPLLPLTARHLLLVSVIPPTVYILCFYGLSALWAFPPPFGLQIAAVPMSSAGLAICVWSWIDTVRTNPEAKARVRCYLHALVAQFNLMSSYVFYYCAFTLAGKEYQTYVSFCLPFLKMLFKNLIRRGLYDMEDVAPSQIVSNVDAFHAIYVSTTIQQAEGLMAVFYIIFVDIIQSAVAYYEVVEIVRRVNKAADESNTVDKYASTQVGPRLFSARTSSRLTSLLRFKYGVIDNANFLVDTLPRIRDHPSVALPRHLLDKVNGVSVTDERPVGGIRTMARISPCRSLRIGIQSPQPIPVKSSSSAGYALQLTNVENAQLMCVTSMLKMLHMIEFYVLVEFVEVAVSVVYTLYVFAMSKMANRIYYKQFSSLTDQQLQATVVHLAIYAALELASFIVSAWQLISSYNTYRHSSNWRLR